MRRINTNNNGEKKYANSGRFSFEQNLLGIANLHLIVSETLFCVDIRFFVYFELTKGVYMRTKM